MLQIMKKSELFFNVLRLPGDFLMLLIAGISTYFLRTEILSAFRPVLFEFRLPFDKYFYLVLFVSLIFVASYAVSGLYSLKIRRGLFDELLKIIVASSAGIMMIIIYIFLRQELFDSRFLVLGGWFFAVIFVFTGRILVYLLQKYYVTRRNFGVHNVVVVGNDNLATAVVERINNDLSYGYRLFKHIMLPDLNIIKEAKAAGLIDEVMLTNPDYPEGSILELVNFCHENHIVFKYVPNIYKTLTTNFDIDIIGGLPLIELKRTRLDGWGKVIKRIFDIFVSIFGLILLSPLFAVIAIVIRSDTPGSVFVALKRISKNKEFDIYKFRSMVKNAHDLNPQLRLVRNDRPNAGPLWKMKDDPRITRVGKIIRRFSIDDAGGQTQVAFFKMQIDAEALAGVKFVGNIHFSTAYKLFFLFWRQGGEYHLLGFFSSQRSEISQAAEQAVDSNNRRFAHHQMHIRSAFLHAKLEYLV